MLKKRDASNIYNVLEIATAKFANNWGRKHKLQNLNLSAKLEKRTLT
jgi:hypothetical protein